MIHSKYCNSGNFHLEYFRMFMIFVLKYIRIDVDI